MESLKYKHTITDEEIDKLFFEFMDRQKIYLCRGMNALKASRMMGVPINRLEAYTKNEYKMSFAKTIDFYRIADVEDLWNESPRISIFEMAKSVGYANVIAFIYHFISHHKCMPSVWKKRYGVI